MHGIFISYRRDDAQGWAGRIQEGLRASFGDVPLFFDLETIAPGQDFVNSIESSLASCRALLALIGPGWLSASDASGRRRLEDPADYVRLEIAAALRRDVLVIPVLLGGAAMPRSSDLPENIAALARRNAHELSDKRWEYDFELLVAALARATGFTPREKALSGDEGPAIAVGNELALDEVKAGDIAGIKTEGVEPAIPARAKVEVARGARIERSKIGDIVGVKIERKDGKN